MTLLHQRASIKSDFRGSIVTSKYSRGCREDFVILEIILWHFVLRVKGCVVLEQSLLVATTECSRDETQGIVSGRLD